jgi:hypothetical protein
MGLGIKAPFKNKPNIATIKQATAQMSFLCNENIQLN